MMEWRYTAAPKKEELKNASSPGEFMATAYWGTKGCYFYKFLA
jgi:hypothetical protein